MPFSKAGKRPVKNSQFMNPMPDHLRTLVQDYLCHNCYTGTARAFAQDSAVRHLDRDGDEIIPSGKSGEKSLPDLQEDVLRLAELRQQVRIHILSGRVDEARNLLNEHFPTVLCEKEPRNTGSHDTPKSMPGHVEGMIAPTSVDPAHLSLNLRVMAFIEASRTSPLNYNPNPHQEEVSSRLPAKLKSSPQSAIFELDNTDDKQEELIRQAQKLYLIASMLPNPSDRAAYLMELGLVGGLLAYQCPENSPMAKYLSQARREAVANSINSAILYRTGQTAVSNLELYTRYTSTIWSYMHENHMKLPLLAKRPIGVSLPTISQIGQQRPTSQPPTKDDHEKEFFELAPVFDLRQFLDGKS